MTRKVFTTVVLASVLAGVRFEPQEWSTRSFIEQIRIRLSEGQ